MDQLGINIGYVIMQILIVSILFIVLRHFLYTPIQKTLEERKQRIAKGLEDARQAAVARDNADAEAKKILDAARGEAAKIRSDATVQAEEAAETVKGNAQEEAQQIIASARAEAEIERNQILSELRGQVAAIAIAAANKIVGESLDEKRQRELIQNFFAKVPADVAKLSGARAEVISALPLTDEEKQAAEKNIKADNVEYKVDPSILGGLIVRVGDQVVDSSVANQMSGMRDRLSE